MFGTLLTLVNACCYYGVLLQWVELHVKFAISDIQRQQAAKLHVHWALKEYMAEATGQAVTTHWTATTCPRVKSLVSQACTRHKALHIKHIKADASCP